MDEHKSETENQITIDRIEMDTKLAAHEIGMVNPGQLELQSAADAFEFQPFEGAAERRSIEFGDFHQAFGSPCHVGFDLAEHSDGN